DMQSPFMALLTVAKGPSVVMETVFENRFMHVTEFNRMGGGIRTEGKCAIIPGNKKLKGAHVRCTDLRAGAAVVLTGLVATGSTEVTDIYHIDRGYENLVDKLKALGANIERV
ncbi:MAG: UDP-N-acetylglucosamine 1-carboxyvinyltransferase, partial [Bacillota bacterium]|nr:UDP-N-acetylglucosamine 1-carboxyvinyltransferase [Bacillota bacterium]